MRSDTTNNADRAYQALARGYGRNAAKFATESAVCDMLTDLRHLCDAHGLSFCELDRRAQVVYLDEKADEEKL